MAHLLIGVACVLWVELGLCTATVAVDERWSGARALMVWFACGLLFCTPCLASGFALLAMEGP